jgi:hypothetical protein
MVWAIGFAVRIEKFLAAVLPSSFESERCDVPVRPTAKDRLDCDPALQSRVDPDPCLAYRGRCHGF